MLQGTGHPAEKPELTQSGFSAGCPSRFLVVRARSARYGMIRPSNLHEIYKQNTVNFFKIFPCYLHVLFKCNSSKGSCSSNFQ